MSTRKWIPYLILLLLLAGCTSATPAGPQELTVMTHDSFAISEDVLAAFEQENNAKVQFLKAGDTGTALNKAILSKDNPLADVFYGVDNTFLSRALDEGIFEPYASPALADIPAEFKLDPQNRALPVDYGDVCLNYDKAYFAEQRPARRPPPWRICSSPSTRACWWCKTRPPPRPGWPSCWRPSAISGRTATWITGKGWSPTTCRWSTTGRPPITPSSAAHPARGRAPSSSPTTPARPSR